MGGCPSGVMVKTMECGVIVGEFELQSCNYVHFRTNTSGYEPLHPPKYRLNSTTKVLLEG